MPLETKNPFVEAFNDPKTQIVESPVVQKSTVSTYTPYAPTGGNVANITSSLTGNYSVGPEQLRQAGYEARSGGLYHTSTGQMVPGINYEPGSSQILGDPNALQSWLTSLGRTSTTQTPAEAAGQTSQQQVFGTPQQPGFPNAVPGGQDPNAPQASPNLQSPAQIQSQQIASGQISQPTIGIAPQPTRY